MPTERFEFCEWKQPRVNIDYHVEVDRHYYSVLSTLVGEIVDSRFTASTVELHRGKRVTRLTCSDPRFWPTSATFRPACCTRLCIAAHDRTRARALARPSTQGR